MKIAERIIIVALILAIVGLAAWLYFAVQYKEAELRESVAAGEFQITGGSADNDNQNDVSAGTAAEWRAWFPQTVPITIADVPVEASVADSLAERIKGLSGTAYLPDNIVKLFAFGVPGTHSIWMKDMNYAIDILWVAEGGEIVHIEENVSPDSYPKSFSSPTPAWFVIEANAGFVAKHGVQHGQEVVLPVSEPVQENQLLTPELQEAAE